MIDNHNENKQCIPHDLFDNAVLSTPSCVYFTMQSSPTIMCLFHYAALSHYHVFISLWSALSLSCVYFIMQYSLTIMCLFHYAALSHYHVFISLCSTLSLSCAYFIMQRSLTIMCLFALHSIFPPTQSLYIIHTVTPPHCSAALPLEICFIQQHYHSALTLFIARDAANWV